MDHAGLSFPCVLKKGLGVTLVAPGSFLMRGRIGGITSFQMFVGDSIALVGAILEHYRNKAGR